MKKIAFAFAAIVSQAGGLMAQNNVVIRGTVKGDLQGHRQVYVYGPEITSDTAYIENGKFEFTIPYKEGMIPIFYDEYDVQIKKGVSPYMVLVDRPGVINLDGIDIAKGLVTARVSGMKSAEDYLAYSRESEKLTGEKSKELIKKLIITRPDAYIGVFVLGSYGKQLLTPDEMEGMYKLLSDRLQKSKAGKSVADYIAASRRSAVGQQVQDFTVITPEDKELQFQALKGKYLVLDFWASWCGPCVKSFPHMKEMYKKYKSDKFEICSISVDQSKDAWLKALKQHELPWVQALDTAKVSSSHFAVTGIPAVFLIDPSGKIIAKETGFEENGAGVIEKKLIEIFGEK